MYKNVKVKAKCKCNKCGDTFNVNSDSFSECLNNCCSVRVNEFGTSYSNGKSKCYELLYETKEIEYDSDYYIKLDEESELLISRIEREKDAYIHKHYDINTDKTEYLKYIEFELSTSANRYFEINEFKADISFTNKNDNNSLDIIKSKLIEILKFLEDFNNGKIDISTNNRKELENKYNWDRKQLKQYDYTFYIIDED